MAKGRVGHMPNKVAPMHTVLVTGGRAWGIVDKERLYVEQALEVQRALHGMFILIHGGAEGVDRAAWQWADKRHMLDGWPPPVTVPRLGPQPWTGPARNQRMVDMRPAMVLVFPGGNGTADCCTRALAAGLEVLQLTPGREIFTAARRAAPTLI